MKSYRDLTLATQAFLEEGKKDKGVALPTLASEYTVGGISFWIPSGCRQIDQCLGGGLPAGRISELYSVDTSEGKTTLAIMFAINCQMMGGGVVWWESEASVDWNRAERMGLDREQVLTWAPPYLEAGYDMLENCVLTNIEESSHLRNLPTLIVWDTISFAETKNEAEGDMYADGMMDRPKINKRHLNKINNRLFKLNSHLLLISQSIKSPGRFGPSYTTPGGSAIKQRASMRMELRRVNRVETDDKSAKLEGGDLYTGITCEFKTVKNKTAMPFRSTEVVLRGDEGFSDVLSMARHFREHPAHSDMLVEKGGWWYCCADTGTLKKPPKDRICLGKARWAKLPDLLKEIPEIKERWLERIDSLWELPTDRMRNEDGWVVPIDKEGNLLSTDLPVFDKSAAKKVLEDD